MYVKRHTGRTIAINNKTSLYILMFLPIFIFFYYRVKKKVATQVAATEGSRKGRKTY